MLACRASLGRRAAIGLVAGAGLAGAGLLFLAAAGPGGAAADSRVTLTAGQTRPTPGEQVRLRARATGQVPASARLVLLVARLDRSGRVRARVSRPCAIGAATCTRTVRLASPGRIRYRAILRRAGRAIAGSPPIVVAWRPAADPPGSGAGAAPPVGGGAPGPAPTPGGTPGPAPLAPGLPADIAGFEGWTRLNAEPIPPNSAASQEVGFDAHSSTKNVYVNIPRAAARTRPFPDGTIVVKSGRRGGGDVALIAIMRRIAGIDPTHGNWQFVEYLADGKGGFATGPGLRDAGCWGCHGLAADRDWVFTPTDG